MAYDYPHDSFRQEQNVSDQVTLSAEVPCTIISVKQVKASCWNPLFQDRNIFCVCLLQLVVSLCSNKKLRRVFRSCYSWSPVTSLTCVFKNGGTTNVSQFRVQPCGTVSQERKEIFSSLLVLLVTFIHSKSVICFKFCICLCARS